MTPTTTRRMIGGEILKLRKKRSAIAWTLFFGAGGIVIYYLGAAIQHASDPAHHAPAGGISGFTHGIQGLAIFLGPLAAAMIGAEAGAGDHATGVFGDLVATGRSRLALFLVRVPAALAVTLAAVTLGFVLTVVASLTLAGGRPTPSFDMILDGAGWVLVANAVVCVLAVGLASLTRSRAIALTVLIGWELVISPRLVDSAGLGSARNVLIDGALLRIEPGPNPPGSPHLSMSILAVFAVLVLWPLVATALGAWRTRNRDA
jgi:hypothetical protein